MLRVSPIRKLVVGLLVLTVGYGLAVPGSAANEDATDCTNDVSYVPDIGHACMTASGLWHMFTPEGEDLGYTHGPDPIPPAEEIPLDGIGRAPVCTDDPENGYYGVLIYARAHDAEDRYDQMREHIMFEFMRANELLYKTAQEHLATRDYVMLCDEDGLPHVANAVLPTDKDRAGPGSIFNEIRFAGDFNNPRVKNWVWYDDTGACGCGGIGHINNDDRATVNNRNNGNAGVTTGITFGYGMRVMMHENGHNNGAVQLSSPQSSGGWHCNDGVDVMCYADGGSTSQYTIVCPTQKWDCNSDDYFNPLPIPGTYLSLHWNMGAQYNRYIVGEDYVLPDLPDIPCTGTTRELGLC